MPAADVNCSSKATRHCGRVRPVGRAVTEALEAAGQCVTIVELNPATVQTQSKLGKAVVHGDISDPAVLEEAGATDADALILTVPDAGTSVRACTEARRLAPRIYIAVRTHHVSGANQATQAGADHVTVEEVITAESMKRAVMGRLVAKDEVGRS